MAGSNDPLNVKEECDQADMKRDVVTRLRSNDKAVQTKALEDYQAARADGRLTDRDATYILERMTQGDFYHQLKGMNASETISLSPENGE